MNNQQNVSPFRWNIWLSGVYLVLFAASLVHMQAAASDAFCGLYAVILALPWSALLILAVAAAKPEVFDSPVPGILILCATGLLNTFLIAWAPSLFRSRPGSPATTTQKGKDHP